MQNTAGFVKEPRTDLEKQELKGIQGAGLGFWVDECGILQIVLDCSVSVLSCKHPTVGKLPSMGMNLPS